MVACSLRQVLSFVKTLLHHARERSRQHPLLLPARALLPLQAHVSLTTWIEIQFEDSARTEMTPKESGIPWISMDLHRFLIGFNGLHSTFNRSQSRFREIIACFRGHGTYDWQVQLIWVAMFVVGAQAVLHSRLTYSLLANHEREL